MQDRRLYIKSKLVSHLLDDVQLDGGRIFLVVNGEEGYASFVLGNDGIGRITRALPDLPLPLDAMDIRIFRMPGQSSAP